MNFFAFNCCCYKCYNIPINTVFVNKQTVSLTWQRMKRALFLVQIIIISTFLSLTQCNCSVKLSGKTLQYYTLYQVTTLWLQTTGPDSGKSESIWSALPPACREWSMALGSWRTTGASVLNSKCIPPCFWSFFTQKAIIIFTEGTFSSEVFFPPLLALQI